MFATIHHRLRPVAVVLGYVQIYLLALYPITYLPRIMLQLAALVCAAVLVVRLRRWRLQRRAGSVPAVTT